MKIQDWVFLVFTLPILRSLDLTESNIVWAFKSGSDYLFMNREEKLIRWKLFVYIISRKSLAKNMKMTMNLVLTNKK